MPPQHEFVDLTGDDDDEHMVLIEREVHDLTLSEADSEGNESNDDGLEELRNIVYYDLAFDGTRYETTTYNPSDDVDGPDFRIKSRDTVELDEDKEEDDRDFLRVVDIVRDKFTGRFYLRGLRFRRTNKSEGKLPASINEVFMTMTARKNDRRNHSQQSMESVPITQALRRRRLIVTNAPFPEYSFRTEAGFTGLSSHRPGYKETEISIKRTMTLVARWRKTLIFDTATEQKSGKSRGRRIEEVWAKIEEWQADLDFRVSDKLLNELFLGYKQVSSRIITFADCFCGGGGASAGARKANLKIMWSLDSDPQAVLVYKNNFQTTTVFRGDVADALVLIKANPQEYRCDILTISPPCQPFSKANANPNEAKNELNHAAFLSIRDLVSSIRPRLVVLEEADGLWIIRKHYEFVQTMFHMFTEVGYSVRSKLHVLSDYGVPQERYRLVVYATCPGGSLPEFPEPTHGPGRHFPQVTMAQAVAPLIANPGRYTHHNTREGIFDDPKPAYSAHQLLRACITTGRNAKNYHPSGRRQSTYREIACYQGLSPDFVFPPSVPGTEIHRIIGNMFPPPAAEAFYRTAALHLERESMERYPMGGAEDD